MSPRCVCVRHDGCVTSGALAAYGWFTKRDLSNLRSILFAGLMFLLLYWLVAIFLPMGMFEKVICFVGLAVFLGYTAYDTQKIKGVYDAYRLTPKWPTRAPCSSKCAACIWIL